MAKRRERIFAGTSGWAYPSWKPGFYPKTVPARRFLEHYASRLNSVEVNYTFRTLPTAPQLAEWMAAVPPGFRFSFKAPEMITHRRRLRECADPLDEFLVAIAPVQDAGRLGLLLFQLPPNFKADLARLEAFLAHLAMRHAGRVSFEFRNESWFTPACFTLLRAHGAAVCIAESEDLSTPEVHTAVDFTSYRLRMPGGYDATTVAAHAKKFKKLSKTHEVYVYYKHEDEPAGPLAAESMLAQTRPAKRTGDDSAYGTITPTGTDTVRKPAAPQLDDVPPR